MGGIYNFLKNYPADVYPFHMPGHKRNPKFFPEDLYKYDVTEIPGADYLHAAEGVILELNEKIRKKFGSDESFFVVNGSSCGVLAAVLSCVFEGDTIIAARNSHRSFFSALTISGANAIFIMPEIIPLGVTGGINPDLISDAIRKNPSAKAVFITSPTYEGFVSDISSIAKICHENDKILIVDEAHGSHFPFHGAFPKTALSLGADIVINSLHKTLPMMTQVSVLHVQGERVDRSLLKRHLSMLQTSSPSYPFMVQTDYSLDVLETEKNLFELYIENIKNFRREAAGFKILKLLDEEYKNKYSIYDIDISKFVFGVHTDKTSAAAVETLLFEKYRVQLEMCGLRHMIAITSVADTEEGFNKLLKGIKEIDSSLEQTHAEKKLPFLTSLPKAAQNPKNAMYAKNSEINLYDSVGRISAEFIIPYPPGIPIIVPGEVIDDDVINALKLFNESGISILGVEKLKEGKIKVL